MRACVRVCVLLQAQPLRARILVCDMLSSFVLQFVLVFPLGAVNWWIGVRKAGSIC